MSEVGLATSAAERNTEAKRDRVDLGHAASLRMQLAVPAIEPALVLLVLSISAAVADDLCWIAPDKRKFEHR